MPEEFLKTEKMSEETIREREKVIEEIRAKISAGDAFTEDDLANIKKYHIIHTFRNLFLKRPQSQNE